MEALLNLYILFKKDYRKERFDIILEPLQAMTQLPDKTNENSVLLIFAPQIDNGQILSIDGGASLNHAG